MRILEDQLARFGAAVFDAYVVRVREHLEAVFPETLAGLDEATVRARVTEAIALAREHGIRSEKDVCLVIDACFVGALDEAAIRAVLGEAGRSSRERARSLLALALARP